MANGAALIDEGLWRRDKEFRALPRMAQCTFVQILSNKDTDCAGILTLSVDLLAKACDELTVEQVWIDLKALEAARFVFVDADTDELLIRSYVKRISIKGPNLMVSALRRAKIIHSEKLRAVLASELRRLARKDASAVADEIDPTGTHSEPLPNPSGTLPDGITLPEPPSVGKGKVQVLTSVDTQEGETLPPEFCSKHPNGTDKACRPCGQARQAREHWETQHTATAATAKARHLADFWVAVRKCDDCDALGYADDPESTDGVIRCPNHDWESIA